MKKFIQKLFLSILGVLFMAGFREFLPDPSIWHYLSLLLFLLILYYLIYPLFQIIWRFLKGQYKKLFPKVGILNGSIISPQREHKCEKGWTNVTPSMWNLALQEALHKKIELIPVSKINDSFSLIINPFGDIFPEQDTKLHKTFYAICNFVKNGGFYVATGGSFFAHQNTIHSFQHQWVFTKTTNGMQSLKDSFLFLEFGVETTGDEFTNGKLVFKEPAEVEVYQKSGDKKYTGEINLPQKLKRFRAATVKTSDYIPFVREKEDKSFPIVAVRYGKGYLIQAGIFLESETSEEFKLLISIIKNLINNKFKNL